MVSPACAAARAPAGQCGYSTACDHYARTLARTSSQAEAMRNDPALRATVESAAARVQHNIAALADLISQRVDHRRPSLLPARDLLDTAEQELARNHHFDSEHSPDANSRRLLGGLRALRSIDEAIRGLARDLGAEDEGSRITD